MKKFFEMETRILFRIIIILIGFQIPVYFLHEMGIQGWLLIGFLLFLVSVTLIAGLVVGLFISLLFIFLAGSFLFYIAMPGTAIAIETITIPLPIILGYGFILILFVLFAGRMHDRVIQQSKENRRLKDEVKQFVAVDAYTGFDNKYRMEMEVKGEMSRTKRYGSAFTLLLLQMDFYEDFSRLYGEKELHHLLHSLAEKIQKTTRFTDLKFRYAEDRFALLLTNTTGAGVDVVYEKLANTLKTHQLTNGKYVTLTFRIGHMFYEQDTEIDEYETLFSKTESEMITREL